MFSKIPVTSNFWLPFSNSFSYGIAIAKYFLAARSEMTDYWVLAAPSVDCLS